MPKAKVLVGSFKHLFFFSKDASLFWHFLLRFGRKKPQQRRCLTSFLLPRIWLFCESIYLRDSECLYQESLADAMNQMSPTIEHQYHRDCLIPDNANYQLTSVSVTSSNILKMAKQPCQSQSFSDIIRFSRSRKKFFLWLLWCIGPSCSKAW